MHSGILKIGVAALTSSLLGGCALWPQVVSDSDFKPSGKESIYCKTTDYDRAMTCATSTLLVFSDMLTDTGNFDRGAAYAAWSLATVTGGILEHDGGKGVLKGLGVVSGGLLGLTSMLNTDAQRRILLTGYEQLECAMRAARAAKEAPTQFANAFAPGSTFKDLLGSFSPYVAGRSSKLTNAAAINPLEVFQEQKTNLHYQEISTAMVQGLLAIASAEASVGTQLSDAVLSIRHDVRTQLEGLVNTSEEDMNNQRNRVVDMVGEIIRQRGELQEQLAEPTAAEGEEQKEVNQYAMAFVAGTSSVAAELRTCVDPATSDAIGG